MTTFLYHFHGLGGIDFSAMQPEELAEVDQMAADADLEIVPTIYLRRDRLSWLEDLLSAHAEAADRAGSSAIAGFAVEGPLLGPLGGIPRSSRWQPSAVEWERLGRLGWSGLRYVVMAPDALGLDDEIGDGLTFSGLLEMFYDNSVRVALGHFHRGSPEQSATRMMDVLCFLHDRYVSSQYLVLTDHLYNDMPRNFTHAWRTAEAWGRRDAELQPVMQDWRGADLFELLGPVPATMLQAARDDLLIPAINFDGQHVDLAVTRKTWEWLGSARLIAMTDHTDVLSMAAEPLVQDDFSGLLLRRDGAVAAGSTGAHVQREKMRAVGLDDDDIAAVFCENPRRAVAFCPQRLTS